MGSDDFHSRLTTLQMTLLDHTSTVSSTRKRGKMANSYKSPNSQYTTTNVCVCHLIVDNFSSDTGFGYPIYFCDRHFLLSTLYNNIKDKSHLLLNKKVSRIDHNHKTATVQCKDGTTYTGDVIVGADGVSSLVRQEMFRHFEVNEPSAFDHTDRSGTWIGIRLGRSSLTPGSHDGRVHVYVRRLQADSRTRQTKRHRHIQYRPRQGSIPLALQRQVRPHILVRVRKDGQNLPILRFSAIFR
jgi:2-polyprenyl-6-methoxyphenol hydroxylase-like FAD-dependent oxidoreductase